MRTEKTPAAPDLPELMSTSDVAERFDVSTHSITRWVRDGSIHPIARAPGPTGAYMFHRSEVERLERLLEGTVTVDVAAEQLGLSRQSVFRALKDGRLQGPLLRGERRVTKASLARLREFG